MNALFCRFLFAAPLCTAISVQAADGVWLQCARVDDNAARLACYDQTALARQSPSPMRPPSPAGKAVDIAESIRHSVADKSVQVVTDAADTIDAAVYTPLSRLYDLDHNDEAGILTVRAHQPMYLMPLWYSRHPNKMPQTPTQQAAKLYGGDVQRAEAKMQISFKTKIAQDLFKTRADVWFGYTQLSHWQVYNQVWSAPFRGTDYQPEFLLTQPVKLDLPGGGSLRVLGGGIVHQSNGQSDPLSRSWNRLYAMAGMEWGKLTVLPRLWWRIPTRTDRDNNPDIIRYMGYGDLTVQYRFNKQQTLGALLRYNPGSGKGGMRVDYTFPLAGRLKGYVQAFHGYGENLLDYNHLHRSIGVGLMVNDWDGF